MATGNNSAFAEDITIVPAEDEYTSLVSCIECLPDATENLEESDNETDSVGFCEKLEQIYSLSISTGGNTMEDTARSKMEQFFKTDQSISIIVLGKTGAGKSALINGLVGRNIATEGASPHSVTGLKQQYEGEYVRAEGGRVKVIVWDSPGLQDGHHQDWEYLHHLQQHEHHRDQKYLHHLQQHEHHRDGKYLHHLQQHKHHRDRKYLHHLQQHRRRSRSGRSGFGQTNFSSKN